MEKQNPFKSYAGRVQTQDGQFSDDERRLANRNVGTVLESLALDITPTGAHYLLNHFDIPFIDQSSHVLTFSGAFDNPYQLNMSQIKALPQVRQPVTLECAGNGRAAMSPRSHSMPWMYEAVGTYEWIGTPLAPLIAKASPNGAVDITFRGADYGYDKACGHHFERSLTPKQLDELEVLLVYGMNNQDLLPQHGAPLRIIVPGWYGMASVKWLTNIEALAHKFEGFQQVRTYCYRTSDEDAGIPITNMRVKSLMVPPGVPDWSSRKRLLDAGPVTLFGRAWSGAGLRIASVEVEIEGQWRQATLDEQQHKYSWVRWQFDWHATAGSHRLRCRATDETGATQPLTPPWDVSGFANNVVQQLDVFVE